MKVVVGSELTDLDRDVLLGFLRPAFVLPLARELGHGDVIRGAQPAWTVVRSRVLAYLRQNRRRDHLLIEGLRAMGFWGGHLDGLEPVQLSSWRRSALRIWPSQPVITGYSAAFVGDTSSQDIRAAALKALGIVLTNHPELNLALLDGRIFQRRSPVALLHSRVARGEVRSVRVPLGVDDPDQAFRRSWRQAVRLRSHPWAEAGIDLVTSWLEAGFITSPASIMVSPVADEGVMAGIGCLVPGNGVPASLTIGQEVAGNVSLGWVWDHRVYDAEHAGVFYRTLEEEIPKLLGRVQTGVALPNGSSTWIQ